MEYTIEKDIYGIKIRLRTKEFEFFKIAEDSMISFPSSIDANSPFDLDVRLISYNKYSFKTKINIKNENFHKLGTNVFYSDGDRFIFNDNDLYIEMINSDKLIINGIYNERFDRSIRNDLIYKNKIRYGLYMNLLRVMVYHPVFNLLEIKQNKHVIHSSLLEKDGKSICFVGYNGAGKTSIAYYLSKGYGYNLLSDNFNLYDGKFVYPFPETIRLSDESLNSMKIQQKDKSLFFTNGKKNYANVVNVWETKPIAFIFCHIGNSSKSTINQISNNRLVNWTQDMHDYIKEFHNYTFTAPSNYLNYKNSDDVIAKKRIDQLLEISSNVNCFEFISNNNLDYNNAAKEILNAISIK